MKKNNPYPGITRIVDRHGKVRWRFRKRGRPSCYILGQYASKEFETSYGLALSGQLGAPAVATTAKHGSFNWLIEKYYISSDWQRIGPTFKKNLGNQIERFRRAHGDRRVADLQREHIEALVAQKMDTPSAANELLKLFRRFMKFAIRQKLITVDVSQYIRPLATNDQGYHTWTDEEIDTFETKHHSNAKAILALRLMLYTGAARQDVISMGWQNVRNGRIHYRRKKTGGTVDLPIVPQLLEVLQKVPETQLLFLTHGADHSSYKPETFGNYFNDKCKEAGLLLCSAHGLRKAGATRLANGGGTEHEIMAFLGHKTTDEAKTYTKAANRVSLGSLAMKWQPV